MHFPRMTIRRLMLIVAVAAVLMVGIKPLWQYWFASPIRKVVYQFPIMDKPTTVIFDTRNGLIAAELEKFKANLDAQGACYKVERTAASDDE